MTRPAAPRPDHDFLGADRARNEALTWVVIAITMVMLAVEIAAGEIFGSMALTADGWHMATHAGALLITALAYLFARRNLDNPDFTFGPGKMGDLAGFASAIVLGLVALLIAWESLMRLYAPVAIDFTQALLVAGIGLVVNLVCAWVLNMGNRGHGHAHRAQPPDHPHDRAAPAPDHNLRAASAHVVADALTSVLAIAALILGRLFGWVWLDPAIGILAGLVIARWSIGLMRDTGRVLLDHMPQDGPLPRRIRTAVETGGTIITDLHIWQLGPGHHGVILAVTAPEPVSAQEIRARLAALPGLSHLTVEVSRPG